MATPYAAGPSMIPRRTSISTGSGSMATPLSRSGAGSNGVAGNASTLLSASGLPVPSTTSAATRTLKRTSLQAGLAPPGTASKRSLHAPSTPASTPASLAALKADIQASASATAIQRQLISSQRENSQLLRELGALQERIKSLEKERAILLSREEKYQIKDSQEKDRIAHEKRSLVDSLSEYRAKCEELEDEVDELRSAESRTAHTAQIALEEKSNIEKQMVVLQEELDKVDDENSKLKADREELKEAREKIKALEKELSQRPMKSEKEVSPSEFASPSQSKAQQDVSITDVLRKELHHQVQHLKTLDTTNARLTRELNALKQDRQNFELLKEEKLSLETKLRNMQVLRQSLSEKEAELENLKRERNEWTSFLSKEGSEGQDSFKSPIELAKTLASSRIEVLSLQDKLGNVTAAVKSRDQTIEELEERIREFEEEVVPAVQNDLQSTSDKLKRLQRKEELDEKELRMLREQINSYATEESSIMTGGAEQAYDSQKSLQITHLEELLQAYKQEIAKHSKESERLRGILESRGDDTGTIDSDIKLEPSVPETPSKGKEALNRRLVEQIRANEDLQETLRNTQAEYQALELEVESLEAQIDTLNHALGRGEYNTGTTKVLALSENPADMDLAVRTEALERLKEENRVLLEKLESLEEKVRHSPTVVAISTSESKHDHQEDTVPKATYVNLVAEKEALQQEIEKAEKQRNRLREVFARTAQELRDACRSLFGYKIEPLDGGRFKVTTVFGGSEYFLVFGPATSAGTGNSHSKFQLVGGNDTFVQSGRVQQGVNFWIAERACVPGFLSTLTLELFEESTRGRTAGWTEGLMSAAKHGMLRCFLPNMPAPSSRRAPPRVLITNDDGPPCHESPFIEGLYKTLSKQLNWNQLKVVIPSTQKSWIGKAYQIRDTIGVSQYTPSKEVSDEPWTMLDGTPATCSNIALHNLYPGKIDLVVSGPNYGRNTSSAFALSSGTIGAALSASMSGVPAIALSYGIFDRPIPEGVVEKAHELACVTILKLWEDVFSKKEDLADVYNINIPLTTNILSQTATSPKIVWTTLAGAKYGRLFVPIEQATPKDEAEKEAEESGPAAVAIHSPSAEHPHEEDRAELSAKAFRFKPDISLLINPDDSKLVPGTDIHALHNGYVSVTPLRATFGLGQVCQGIETEEGDGKGQWKL